MTSKSEIPSSGQSLHIILPSSEYLFCICVIILLATSLYPVFGLRLLPMQDYPQHLFLAQVATTYEDPAFNWSKYYDVNLGLRPYMLWYLLIKYVGLVTGVELAGKILFSLYLLLITVFIYMIKRSLANFTLPWSALLLYPFAFNQIYFMGFSNYILSLPLLFIALLDLEHLLKHPAAPWRIALHSVYIFILILNHPYTFLVYLTLAFIASFLSGLGVKQSLKKLAPEIALGALFILWYVTMHSQSSSPTATAWEILWCDMRASIKYYLLMFTGMRLTRNIDWASIFLWITCAAVIIIPWLKNGKESSETRWPLTILLASFEGFMILPFWFGYYAYFNVRLAPVTYFALALLLSRLKISPRAGITVAVCSFLLVILSIQTQMKVSAEAETILPIIGKMKPNALVLPLIFDGTSENIDPWFFPLIHSHEANYYNLLQGGANPHLFPNAMMPVQYKTGASLPFPTEPALFSWSQKFSIYDYFLVRSPPDGFDRMMQDNCCQLSAVSGYWHLYSKNL